MATNDELNSTQYVLLKWYNIPAILFIDFQFKLDGEQLRSDRFKHFVNIECVVTGNIVQDALLRCCLPIKNVIAKSVILK